MARKVPLGVLISGGGTNLQAIIDAIESGGLDATIRVVISNREDAAGLERAAKRRIPTAVVDHRKFATREDFDETVVEILRAQGVELVVLAGFMRLLSPVFVKAFSNRVLNIHPALLPAFPGLHAQKKALEAGVRVSGCTVHFVNEECDQGPIIIQAAVPVFSDDTEESLSARILEQEHRIYPKAIQLYSQGRLRVSGNKVRVEGDRFAEDRVLLQPSPEA
jgi:phosphoribosylglycinamide formyltransferase-1